MKRIIFILALVFTICGGNMYAQHIRVACVGNSITYGYGIPDREHKCYPFDLGKMLGDKYEVENFGNSGRTLLMKGDLPYMKEQTFKDALDFKPEIVVIKLGTNDTKPQNWIHHEDFEKDMITLIDSFKTLPTKPRIILCTPIAVYHMQWGINDSIVFHGVMPYVKAVAKKEHVEYLNLYPILKGKKDDYIKDGVHPNADGALVIAQRVYKKIKDGK
jgi:lysophospholipase L1-like esterase